MSDSAISPSSDIEHRKLKAGPPGHRSTTSSPNRAILFATVALVGLLLSGCSSKKEAKSEPVVSVQTATVKKKPIQEVVSAEGVLYPLHEADIVPKISAPVARFYVERGDHVHAGQLLAVLENTDLKASVAENQGNYEQAEANFESMKAANLPEQVQTAKLDVKSAKAAADAAQHVYVSSQKLYQQGALAKKQLDQAEVAVTQARNQLEIAQQHLAKLQSVGEKAQLKASQGQLAAAQGRYQNAQAQLSYTEIRSPIDGVVTARPLYPGQMASTSMPLVTVMNVSKVIARAHIPASQAELLKVGDAAAIIASGRAKDLPAKITVVSPAVDPGSTTVEIRAEAANPHDTLKPGSTVDLTFVAKKVADALVIPKSAVLKDPDIGTYVMVAGADNRAHQTKVETGIEQGGDIQILKGLTEGERVVTEGNYGLPDGARLKY